MKNIINPLKFTFTALAILASGFYTPVRAQKSDYKKNDKQDSLRTSGKASFYANMLQGANTSSGEAYDKNDFTCAHRTLPFNTILSVTNKLSGKKVIVRVNDRGPYRKGRIIDLSRAAAKKLEMLPKGVTKVKIQVLGFPDNFSLKDSLIRNGEVFDIHGKPKQLKRHQIYVWKTIDLKHAVYMANNLEKEYTLDSVYIKASGERESRNYALYILNIFKKEEADILIASLKNDGFSLCRYEKK